MKNYYNYNNHYYISEPNQYDVLLGRGTRSNTHIGNILYRKELEKIKLYYRTINKRDEKTEFSSQFILYLKNKYNTKFLKMDATKKLWYEVPNVVARKKVCHALREDNTPEIRAKKRKLYNNNNNTNNTNNNSIEEEILIPSISSLKMNNNNNNMDDKDIIDEDIIDENIIIEEINENINKDNNTTNEIDNSNTREIEQNL